MASLAVAVVRRTFNQRSSGVVKNRYSRKERIGQVIPGVIVCAIGIVIFTVRDYVIKIALTPKVLHVAVYIG